MVILHHIFLDVGLPSLDTRPEWLENIKTNTKLLDATLMLWGDKEVAELLDKYPQYKSMVNSFEKKFYLVDWIRYLILYEYGGIYIDCDVRLKKELHDCDRILGDSNGKINNNVIKVKDKQEAKDLLLFSIGEYYRIKNNNMYKDWAGRRFTHSVGCHMVRKFCKLNNLTSDIKFNDYFIDSECKSWMDGGPEIRITRDRTPKKNIKKN